MYERCWWCESGVKPDTVLALGAVVWAVVGAPVASARFGIILYIDMYYYVVSVLRPSGCSSGDDASLDPSPRPWTA